MRTKNMLMVHIFKVIRFSWNILTYVTSTHKIIIFVYLALFNALSITIFAALHFFV